MNRLAAKAGIRKAWGYFKIPDDYLSGFGVPRSGIKSQSVAFQDKAGGEQNVPKIPSLGDPGREIGTFGENTQVLNFSGNRIVDKGPGKIVTGLLFVPVGPMA